MVRCRFAIALAGSLLFSEAIAAPFDIVFQPGIPPTPSQQALLDQGEAFWEAIVPAYQPGITLGPLRIEFNDFNVDGPGGTLAFAQPFGTLKNGGFVLPSFGGITFDSADLAALEADGTAFDVLVHEIAHVMGFGTLWTENGLYVDGTGQYLGKQALLRYRSEFDPGAAFVPVELGVGPGSDDAHWAEAWPGGINELMTSFINPPIFLSDTTIASMRDLGYAPLLAPVPLPGGLGLAFGALACLAALRYRPR